MHYSLCWLAVRGKVSHMILDELKLRRTGDSLPQPSAIAGVELKSGWYIVAMDQETELLHDMLLSEMSLECECIACFIDDSSSVSSAVGWKNSKKGWSALHDGQKGEDHLILRGEFPGLFGPILEQRKALQKTEGGRHILSVPIELAFQLTGYRHDRGSEYGPYEVLQRAKLKPGKQK
jgi:hypothetical protein